MHQDDAPQVQSTDMSQIEKEWNGSASKASIEYNESLDPIHEKGHDDDTQSNNGKTHEDRGLTTDAESFMGRWLKSLRMENDTPLRGHLIRFLTLLELKEGLEALATSFKEIVRMTGEDYSAITLMKLKNA